jgi:tetratricopeptide (TPR) repeat protein
MFQRALSLSRQGLEKDPENGELHRLAGVAALESGDFALAKNHLDAAIRLDPEDPDALFHLSRYHTERGAWRRAEDAAKRALALVPEAGVCWAQLAWIYYQESDFKRAREHARRALILDGNDARAANLLAVIEAECSDGTKGNPEAQLAALQALLAEHPEDAALHHNLGLVYYEVLRDDVQAARHFATAVELNPEEPRSRHFLAKAIRRQDPWLGRLYWFRFLFPLRKAVRHWLQQARWRWAVVAPVLLLMALPLAVSLLAWTVLIWPLAKLLEWLSWPDYCRRMRILASPGPLGIYRWPRSVRLALCGGVATAYWLCLWHYSSHPMMQKGAGLLVGLAIAEACGHSLGDAWRAVRRQWQHRGA